MRRTALLVAAVLGATLFTFVPANGRTAWAAPTAVVAVVIEGTGFGHGRGMSQWGAYGWAVDQNKSWQWILDHYYGGTTLGNVATAQCAHPGPAARSRQCLHRRSHRRFGHGVSRRAQQNLDVRGGDLTQPVPTVRVELDGMSRLVEPRGPEWPGRQGIEQQRRRAADPGVPQRVPYRG